MTRRRVRVRAGKSREGVAEIELPHPAVVADSATTAEGDVPIEGHDGVAVLADRLAPLFTQLRALQDQARALGVFPNDRELLACPSCGLAEDVRAGGELITNVGAGEPDTGLRFVEPTSADGPFRCPACGIEVRLSEE